MCPVCTVTVIAGLGISRMLGIDDAITSIWIGGFILSFTFVMINWLNKKWSKLTVNKYQLPIIVLMYLLVLVPLKWNGSIGTIGNTLLGIDKILFGITLGSVFFLIGVWADKKVRLVKGKQLFNYQKVVFPVLALATISLMIYYYGGYLK